VSVFLASPIHLRRSRLAAAVMVAAAPAAACAAPPVEFNPHFLQGGQNLDLQRFEQGDEVPGTYGADILVNGTLVGRRDVELRAQTDGSSALYLGPEVIALIGIDPLKLPQDSTALPAAGGIMADDLGRYVPAATASFDVGEQTLSLNIPQLFLVRDPRGWVDPALWEDGITAVRVSYSIAHQRLYNAGQNRSSTSGTLEMGLNLGGWRLRHHAYLSKRPGTHLEYNAGRTQAHRELRALGMQLTVGEAGTIGDLFEGVNYRGINLQTDAGMLPDSQRDFAPVVRGVAQTNAQVIVRQRGVVLSQTTVPAGPFEINDLYGTGYAGDLQVEVVESDGRVQHFNVPYATVPQLLRPGQRRVNATVGQLQDRWTDDQPLFVETSIRQGISNAFTAYGGITGTEGYGAIVLGGALNTRLGAFAGDLTFARTELPMPMQGVGQRMQGRSYRLTYSRDIAATDTSIALAAYRYSTEGYLNLSDATRLRRDLADGLPGDAVARPRSRMDLTVNQRLAKGAGALFASGSTVDYWNLDQRRTTFSVGYSNTRRAVSYSVSAQRSLQRNLFGSAAARETNSINFNLSVPLGRAPGVPRLSSSLTRSSRGSEGMRAGITGEFGQEGQGNYSVSGDRHDGSTRLDAGVAYRSRTVGLSAGYSRSSDTHGLTLSASGGVLLHYDGITLAQQLGDTVGLVEVPHVKGARLVNSNGVKTNRHGMAVVPYLQPYRRNEVIVDPKGLPLDVELKVASATSVPAAGAIVKMVVPTEQGRSALIEAQVSDGAPLPFGADVRDASGQVVGVVGQGSRLWVRGIEQQGQLFVSLGAGGRQQCSIDYAIASEADGVTVHAVCTLQERPAMLPSPLQ